MEPSKNLKNFLEVDMSMDLAQLRVRVEGIQWYHSIDLGNGIVTKGRGPINRLERWDDSFYFFDELETIVRGKEVLDIGAWDGYISFRLERMGATRLLAVDNLSTRPCGLDGFLLAKDILDSRVEFLERNVYELNPRETGRFDVVIFAGVLYHLNNPFLGLRQACACSRDYIVVETAVSRLTGSVLEFYKDGMPSQDSLGGRDLTYRFAPTERCLKEMLEVLGFQPLKVKVLDKFNRCSILAKRVRWELDFGVERWPVGEELPKEWAPQDNALTEPERLNLRQHGYLGVLRQRIRMLKATLFRNRRR